MQDNMTNPFFSIVIPTRNRPELFLIALQSILEQSFTDIEIIVVNDGTSDEFIPGYHHLNLAQYNNVTFVSLIQRPKGHGQSYSMNHGASIATGRYLCFLDDDDNWTDSDHLSRAHELILKSDSDNDLYFAHQKAFYSDGSPQLENVWIEDLIDKREVTNSDYSVSVPFLLSSKGFAHLNCSIYRREFYYQIEGMDENIRYECDRDIYMRAIDQANIILMSDSFVAKHNIPNQKDTSNMSTLVSSAEKYLFQLQVFNKAIAHSKQIQVIKFAMKSKMYILKKLSEEYQQRGFYTQALSFGKQALAIQFSSKWALYVGYMQMKCLFSTNTNK